LKKKLKWKSNGGIIGSKAKSCCNGTPLSEGKIKRKIVKTDNI
jgi:hypothetical protein